MKLGRMSLALILGFGMIFALIWGLQAVSARSAAPTVRYVSNTSPTCGGRAPCYATIQAAVNASADGDEIRVAAGTYTGSAPVVVGSATFTQVVAIVNKTLTLAGGYTNTNWTVPDASANETKIDALGSGRGMTIIGSWTETVTVSGFAIVGGDYTGMGNPSGGFSGACPRTGADCAGGLFAKQVRLILRDSTIGKNVSGQNPNYSDGGGALFWYLLAGSRVENTRFVANSTLPSLGGGGGASVQYGDGITFSRCSFEENESYDGGGGLTVWQMGGQATIEDTTFFSNTTTQTHGGGLLSSVFLPGLALKLDRVTMRGNEAVGTGAAIALIKAGSSAVRVEMTNVLLTGNRLKSPKTYGGTFSTVGAHNVGMDLHLSHFTVADNFTPSAFHFSNGLEGTITATLTNTLIVSASMGYVGSEPATGQVVIRHTKTMRQYVPATHAVEAGTPVFQENSPVTGNPRLDATYHLTKGSDAINAGVDAGVARDIDYNRRPIGSTPDIGADEYGLFRYLPVLMGQ